MTGDNELTPEWFQTSIEDGARHGSSFGRNSGR